MGKLLENNPSNLYCELGGKGYIDLAKPSITLVKEDREYALHVYPSIDPSGRVSPRQEIKTHEEWKKLKKERSNKIETLTARKIFNESSEDPRGSTAEKFVYGE